MDTRIRVIIVEDHPVTRDGIRACVERDGRAVVVGEAASIAGARELAQLRPQVALVDLCLEDGDGRAVIAVLPVDTRIIVMSQAPMRAVVEAIRAGAHGYLDKGSTSDQVARAVHAVLDGPVLPPEVAALVIGAFQRGQLTPREQDVLRGLAKGYDNREIAEDLTIAVRTINRHLENIRAKLGTHRRSELIRYGRERFPQP